ncbi:MAG: serine hydroxymethyltransferase, partial [Peptococcaceae bacterium]|nr:serine hydroxymethyltransferase [Peptococcaceae bacterium]
FGEALKEDFKLYARKVVDNAKVLADALLAEGFDLVSGGTDNHLMLIDVKSKGLTGKDAERMLDDANVTVNKNTIPFETESPFVTSGIRVGTPAVTSRGMKEAEMGEIAEIFETVLLKKDEAKAKEMVKGLTDRFPMYAD